MTGPRGSEPVGRLAAKISGSNKAERADARRAALIEADVCRRLGIEPDDDRLRELRVDVATASGGRRLVEVVKVFEPASEEPLAMYAIKESHGSEPVSAKLASKLGIGPEVLDVSEDGVILEEGFSRRLNIRRREVKGDESDHYARCLADFFLALVRVEADQLIYHKDERLEHIFVVGEGRDIHLKMIDWGWSSIWLLDRIEEWGSEQFRWFYLQLALGQSSIWRLFVNTLAERAPADLAGGALPAAYEDFARRQAAARGASSRTFLEFIVECGQLRLNTARLNTFAERGADLTGEALSRAWTEAMGRE